MLSLRVCLLLIVPVVVLAGSTQYEKPPVLDAAEMLGAEAIRGEHYQIQPQVLNDGQFNTYTITSQSQRITATTNLMALERAHEFEAMVALQKIKESDAYTKGLEAAIDAPLTLTKNVIQDPLGTLGKLPEGINNLLNDLGAAVSGIGRDNAQQQDNAMIKDLIGFNTLKRRLAAELKVDPYSTNQALQQELNDVAWAMFAGGAPIDIAMMAAPVVVSIAVRAVDRLGGGQLDWKIPPATLRQAMDTQVQALGLTSVDSEKVVYHPQCSLRHQSILVSAMVDLAGVTGRDALLRESMLASDEPACRRNQSLAEMLWSYHHNISKLSSITLRGNNVWLLDEGQRQVLVTTADYLVWTERAMTSLTNPAASATGVFLSGTVSARTRKALSNRQFTLHERVYSTYPEYLQVAAILLPQRVAKPSDGQQNKTGKVVDDVTSGIGNLVGGVMSGLGLQDNSAAPVDAPADSPQSRDQAQDQKGEQAARTTPVILPAIRPPIRPQVLPLINFRQAVNTGDLELFKTSYSSRMQQEFARKGWQVKFEDYVRLSQKGFMNSGPDPMFSSDNIEYIYIGNIFAGAVRIVIDGKQHAEVDVVNENGHWKIDEW